MSNPTLECPCCMQLLPNDEFLIHAFENHPEFFVVLQNFTSPFQALYIQELENEYMTSLARQYRLVEPAPELEENETYEELLHLCEQLGSVKIGVSDEKIATETTLHRVHGSFCCPICLADGKELKSSGVTGVRKIKVCRHAFCKPCIDKWFEENKTCPLCKIDILDLVDVD